MARLSNNQSLVFRWLGVAGMEFTQGDHTLLIDPFLSRPPLKNVFIGRISPDIHLIKEKIIQADHILITHAHYDHLMDVPEIARQTGAQVYGSVSVCRLLQVLQVPNAQLQPLHALEEIDLPYAHLKVLPARHPSIPGYLPGNIRQNLIPPLHSRDYRMDECYSYLIDFEKIKLLVWSSISTQHAEAADIIFLRAVASQGWYAEMLKHVHPRLVIPTHWDNLFLPLSQPIRPYFAPPTIRNLFIRQINLDDFKNKIFLADSACKILVPQVLQPYDLIAEIG